MLHDLGSTNGTYVNGRRVSAPTQLRRGDTIQVGKTDMEIKRPSRNVCHTPSIYERAAGTRRPGTCSCNSAPSAPTMPP